MSAFPPSRILAAVDLSEPSLAALEAAKTLARRWGSRLELVHVEPVRVDLAPPLMPVVGATWSPRLDQRQRWEETLRQAASSFPTERLAVRSIPGWPTRELAELARPRSAGLVVMGTHGYAGLDRTLFGSVAEAVVRRARVPVLALHPRMGPFRCRKILAPWIDRPYASSALRYAARWARSLGAVLEVLHVRAPGERGSSGPLLKTVEGLIADRGIGRGSAASEVRREAADREPLRWDFRSERGEAREVILREAASGRFDLVALSAHRRPLSADFVLGSTVERVLRHSPAAVLAAPSVAPRGRAWTRREAHAA